MTDLIGQGAAAAPMPQTIEGLQGQNRAYRTLCASLEAQMAILTEKGREYQEAVTTLDSEREANAILTDEIAALRARVAAVERLYDKWVLNLEWLDGLRERSDLTEFGDGRHTYATEIVSDLRAILSKQEPEYSGWVEVVDEGESP